MTKNYRNFIKFCKIFSAKGNDNKLQKTEFYRVLLWLLCEFADRDLIPLKEVQDGILMCSSCLKSSLAVLTAGNIVGINEKNELYLK